MTEKTTASDIILSVHPCQGELRRRYTEARRAWRENPFVQGYGMSERDYCDAYVRLCGPLFWTGSATAHITAAPQLDYERAYREAWV